MSTDLLDLIDFSSTNSALIAIRIVSIILLLIISVLLGILPAKVPALHSNPKIIAFVNSFSAGLFLGLGMMHLLAESRSDYNQYLIETPSAHPFPIPFSVAIASFSLILFIERILFQAHNFLHLHTEKHHHDESIQPSDLDELHSALVAPIEPEELECDPSKEEETFKKLISSKEKVAKIAIDQEFHRIVPEIEGVGKKTATNSTVSTPGHQQVSGPYAILIALSIHGIFEGAAVGIQNNPSKAINLVIAVVHHKWAEALTLGVALFRGKLSYTAIILQICLFSAAAPLGILFGWMVSNSSFLVSAVFKAVSAGTFLYIAATELVVEEFSISTNMYSKFCVYLAGIVFMGAIVAFE